jgi:hypothetical protein
MSGDLDGALGTDGILVYEGSSYLVGYVAVRGGRTSMLRLVETCA